MKKPAITICTAFVLALSAQLYGQNCGISSLTEAERANIPITNVLYNIHFVGLEGHNFTPDGANNSRNGLNFAYHLIHGDNGISGSNYLLANFISSIYTPPEFEFLGDSRIRWKKFTDSDNIDDDYDGVWFWDSIPDDFPYENVLNIVVRDVFADTARVEPRGSWNDNKNIIFLDDAIHYDLDWYDFDNVLNHELGHACGLVHVFDTLRRQCEGLGINPEIEDINRDTSKNLMGHNSRQAAITKCQMDIMWNSLHGNGRISRPWIETDCNRLSTQIVIDSGTYVHWNYSQYIRQDVVVEPLATLDITCDIYTNSKIIVKRGGKLIVNGCKISSLCEEKWPGIEVWGNASRLHADVDINNLKYDDPGVVDLLFCTLENAKIGVKANPSSMSNYQEQVAHWGGIIIANQVEFLDVWKAAEFMKYSPSNKSKFVDCYIESTDGLAGITMWGTNGIVIEHCTFKKMNASLDDFGVVSADASYDIVNGTTFEDLENAVHILNSVGISRQIRIDGTTSPNQIFGSHIGIYADYCNALSMKSNIIYNNSGAFRTNNRSSFTVYGNLFQNNANHIHNFDSQVDSKEIQANTFLRGGTGVRLWLHCEDYTIDYNCFEELGYSNDIYHYKANRPVLNNIGAPGIPALNFFNQPAGYSNDVATASYTIADAEDFVYHYPDPLYHIGINPRLIPRCDYEGDNCFLGGVNQRYDAEDEWFAFGTIPDLNTLCGGVISEYFDPDLDTHSYSQFIAYTDSIYKYLDIYSNDTSQIENEHLSKHYKLQRKRVAKRLITEYFTQATPDSLIMMIDSTTEPFRWDMLWSYYVNHGMDSIAYGMLDTISFSDEYFQMDFILDVYEKLTHPQDTILTVDSNDIAQLYQLTMIDTLYASSAARALLFVLEDTLFIPGTPTIPAFQADLTTGFQDTIQAKIGFMAYPNPNKGTIFIDIAPEFHEVNANYSLSLVDPTGQILAVHRFRGKQSRWNIRGILPDHNGGNLYLLQLHSDKKSLGTRKIIISLQ